MPVKVEPAAAAEQTQQRVALAHPIAGKGRTTQIGPVKPAVTHHHNRTYLPVDQEARAVGADHVDERGEGANLQRRAHDNKQIGRFEVHGAQLKEAHGQVLRAPSNPLDGGRAKFGQPAWRRVPRQRR